LETKIDERWTAIRLWDNAHDVDEHHEHEYTRSRGKLDPIVHTFSSVNQAIGRAAEEYSAILDRWSTR
jgi:hypothetical protein